MRSAFAFSRASLFSRRRCFADFFSATRPPHDRVSGLGRTSGRDDAPKGACRGGVKQRSFLHPPRGRHESGRREISASTAASYRTASTQAAPRGRDLTCEQTVEDGPHHFLFALPPTITSTSAIGQDSPRHPRAESRS